MLTRSDPSSSESPESGRTPARPSVAALVDRADIHGLVERLYHPERSVPKEYAPDTTPALRALLGSLDEKIGPYGVDRDEVCAGLRSLGERAIPALIEELGTTDLEVGACISLTLAGIGASALPALVEVIKDGPEAGVLNAGVTIGEMRTGGAQLTPDQVRTLVTVKMSPPGALGLARQQAAAHALGPLHAASIPDWVGRLRDARTPGGASRPAAAKPTATGDATCKQCGQPIETGDPTCPHCGNTRWGIIVAWAAGALLFLAAAILLSPQIGGIGGLIVQWGGWLLGVVLLLAVVLETSKGIRTRRQSRSEPVVAGATGVTPPQPDQADATAEAWIAEKERAPVCDRCNARVTPGAGMVIAPDAFRLVVRQGFGPSPEAVAYAAMQGVSQEQFTRGWRSGLVEQATTPWLLCQSCALQAKAFMPGGIGP